MIERRARVVARASGGVTVEAERESTCGECAASAGCGTAALGKALGRKRVRMELPNDFPVDVGDRVVVGLAEGDLVRNAGLVYLLPLLLMFVLAVAADRLAATAGIAAEWPAAVAAFAGLLAGLRLARLRLRRRSCDPHAGARLLRVE